jgi:hypothetical protein
MKQTAFQRRGFGKSTEISLKIYNLYNTTFPVGMHPPPLKRPEKQSGPPENERIRRLGLPVKQRELPKVKRALPAF